ncbi:hypothetical protein CERSUDRAFT_79232 [Gelatoporia subvermispora B]|uniref:Uncharacterized protein n=1 Tax=Ceriporiopsis subvermispora (strain B) TaxID=914234 RepID=M2RT28_CERS8|nr:hypothetical protein CERSUDRAFT_79232 [Gelatoporia subvermispora B]
MSGAAPQRAPAGPTVWQKSKMGAMMGTGVGLTIGFIFGSYSIIRGGAGPRGALPTLSQYMLSSAATFGFFLAIGSVIRMDSEMSSQFEAARLRLSAASPVMRSREEGAAMIRRRWEMEKNLHQQ